MAAAARAKVRAIRRLSSGSGLQDADDGGTDEVLFLFDGPNHQ
jgi:hypothetical protein